MKIPTSFCPRYTLVGLVVLLALAADSPAFAQSGFDRIRRHSGTNSGKITSMNPLGITISKGGIETKIPIVEIRGITLAGEPSALGSARLAAERGRYTDSLEKIARIPADEIDSDLLRQEIDYYALVCYANLALTGQGDLRKARQRADDFMAKHRRSSFHVLAVLELTGDLLVASGEWESARAKYKKIGKAPSPYYQAQSALLVGRVWQAEGKHPEAIEQFEQALKANVPAKIGKSLKLEATLHKSISQSATGGAQQAATTVKKIIAQADPENARLLARAYNTLGDCYLQSGDNQAALFAFLHVDLLYSSSGKDHAKALHELAKLWTTLGRSDRAQETQQKLKAQYPNSRWAS